MDDLRRQFAALDAVPMPDIRAEIDRRLSMEPTPTVRVSTPGQTAARRPVRAISPAMVMLLVGLLIAAAVGVMMAGAWLPTVTPPDLVTATPVASGGVTSHCAAAQASAAIRTDEWRSGGALPSPQAGWLAVWGSGPLPELILVDPATGERCLLTTFDGFSAPSERPATEAGPRDWIPPRGTLAWSPDGGALAIVVTESQPCCRYALYVWSSFGLAGPLLEAPEPSYLHVPSWSPDGSMLAVGQSTGSILGARDAASAWIVAGDGRAPRQVHAACETCFGGSVYWSPNGNRIAFRTWSNQDNGESLGVAAGNVDDQVLPLLSTTAGGDALLGWASDESLWVVPFGVTVPITEPEGAGHLFEVPLDPGLASVDHGFLPAGQGVSPTGVAISPDRSKVLQLVERPRNLIGDLMISDFPAGNAETLVEGLPSIWGPAWWSPDSRTIGYLIDVQSPEQGIWLVNADGSSRRKLIGGSLMIGVDVYGLDATLVKPWQPAP